jgi:hypothetical protein
MPNDDATRNRVIELLGGPERAVKIIEAEDLDLQARWEQDVALIGRILRSHLYVEHYLNQYIQLNNPALGPVLDAKLSFEQKIHLIDRRGNVGSLRHGIKHINKVRNRLAHTLSAVLTKNDSSVFFKEQSFRTILLVKV